MMNNNPKYSNERANKFAWFVIILTIAVLVITALILIVYLRSGTKEKDSGKMSKKGMNSLNYEKPLSELPEIQEKQKPSFSNFNGCPPEGDAGDPALNRLKNRTDEGNYVPVDFDALIKIKWPKDIERRNRANWSPIDAQAIARYEGIPIAIEGFLAGAKIEGPESCNCHGADKEMRDYHLWLTKSAGEDRSGSIVVEVSPPLRAKHPNWDIKNLRKIVKGQLEVRISGWLLMDPEHPDQIGKTRGTIWEIHPIMLIELKENGKWISLDNLNSV